MSVVGGEMATPDRIKYIQGKIRLAIQNHQVLWQRLIYNPKDTDVENMLKMLQDVILSLGRRQTELMYQYNSDLRQKYPDDSELQKKVRMQEIGWPDRDEPIKKHVPNGSGADSGKKTTAQIVKRNPNMQLVRPGQKMTSLLKPPVVNANLNLQRKESERLKAAAAKQAESAAAVITKNVGPGQKPKIVLKVDPASRRMRDEKPSDSDSFPELKESELAGYKLSPQDKATDVSELSQEQYLECFGLVHKEKSKSMVVLQTKRKRRTAAGQSDFYKDYFQPKRPYNRKAQMTETESPSSSQDITEVNSTEFSTPSEKPSVPPSPGSSCSTELLEESTPLEGSPAAPEVLEDLGEEGQNLGDTNPLDGDALDGEAIKGSSATSEDSLVAAAVSAAASEQPSCSPGKALVPDAIVAEELMVEGTAAAKECVAEDVGATERSVAVDAASAEESGPDEAAGTEESVAGVSPAAPEESPKKSSAALDVKPLQVAQRSLTATGNLPCPDVESPFPTEAPPAKDIPTDPTPVAARKDPSAENNDPLAVPDSSAALEESKVVEPSKTDDSCDYKTTPDSDVTPSPTNEDDDSSLSPSDLIETETYKSPSATGPPRNIDPVSIGEESRSFPMDISAMIGGDLQDVSADGSDGCSELVNRYLLSDGSDHSGSEDDEVKEEDDVDDDGTEASSNESIFPM